MDNETKELLLRVFNTYVIYKEECGIVSLFNEYKSLESITMEFIEYLNTTSIEPLATILVNLFTKNLIGVNDISDVIRKSNYVFEKNGEYEICIPGETRIGRTTTFGDFKEILKRK